MRITSPSWTVTLHLSVERAGCALRSVDARVKRLLWSAAAAVHRDFQRLLSSRGARGYALSRTRAARATCCIPDDRRLSKQRKAMSKRSSMDLLTPEQARHHLQMIDAHWRADGVRRFERTIPITRGHAFQRARLD